MGETVFMLLSNVLDIKGEGVGGASPSHGRDLLEILVQNSLVFRALNIKIHLISSENELLWLQFKV